MSTQRTREFIDQIAPFAQRVSEEYGIPASVIIAQAALETGWGQSVEGNNFFGIKAGRSWGGETVEFTTHEVLDGNRVSMRDAFRAYGSIGDSVRDYAELITGASRYRDAMAETDNAFAFAAELEEAGYATDPEYAEKLSRIIRSNDLTRFDNATYQARRSTGDSRTYDEQTLREYDNELRRQREANPEPWEEFTNNPIVTSILTFIIALFGLEQTNVSREEGHDSPEEETQAITDRRTPTEQQGIAA